MSRRGMTLVELVVVLAILVAVSGAVVALTDKVDQNERTQESARRLTAIRSAVLGPDAATADGRLVWGGFLQDMGRLPRGTDLADLLRQGDQPAYDPQARCGWRGPYATPLPGRSGRGEDKLSPSPAFYDDWGDDLHGVVGADGGWTLSSSADPDRPRLALAAKDWRMDLAPFSIQVANRTGIDFSAAPRSIRFLLQGPRDGALATIASGADGALDAKGGDTCGLATPFPGGSAWTVGRYRLVLVDAATGAEFADIRARADLVLSPRVQPDDPLTVTLIRMVP